MEMEAFYLPHKNSQKVRTVHKSLISAATGRKGLYNWLNINDSIQILVT